MEVDLELSKRIFWKEKFDTFKAFFVRLAA
jgi:hypothetical protein